MRKMSENLFKILEVSKNVRKNLQQNDNLVTCETGHADFDSLSEF